MTRSIDLSNERFGRLVVINRGENSLRGQARWLCACDCGAMTTVRAGHLRGGAIRSCGCLSVDTVTKHGQAGGTGGFGRTSEYNSWFAMKNRCYNPKYRRFDRYGRRGIAVCTQWRDSFERFFKDMGPKPEAGFTIDRIDNDGDYEPTNCRWLSQADNTRHMRGTLGE